MQEPDDARRAYWTQQFEDAYRFMFDSILPYAVRECGEPFVSLRDAAVEAGVEVLFSGQPHVRQLERLFQRGRVRAVPAPHRPGGHLRAGGLGSADRCCHAGRPPDAAAQ